jgi:hypothetical protein
MSNSVLMVFRACVKSIIDKKHIRRVSAADKEFHFQNWFAERLMEAGLRFEAGGRNTYPDFYLVEEAEGYELKALAYPGRERDFDSNSQVPQGFHNGKTIYYVFGRYPRDAQGEDYPLLDLVICHGDFLNTDRSYVHRNESIRGFGSYGDIMIRDRKMYVVPTPFSLAAGLSFRQTLILPASFVVPGDHDLIPVGVLDRKEAAELIKAYTFDVQSNTLQAIRIPNPNAGQVHAFRAWRLAGTSSDPVWLRQVAWQPLSDDA